VLGRELVLGWTESWCWTELVLVLGRELVLVLGRELVLGWTES
jgi:hypothetical protein